MLFAVSVVCCALFPSLLCYRCRVLIVPLRALLGITNYRDQLQDRFVRSMRNPRQAIIVASLVALPVVWWAVSDITLRQEEERRKNNMKQYKMPESRRINNGL
jgi:hypothetical protein